MRGCFAEFVLSYRATLVFAAVSGEEQGWFGGTRLLEYLRQNGYTIGAMLDNDIVGADFAPGAPHRVTPCEQLFQLNLKSVRLRALAVEVAVTARSCGRGFRQRLDTALRATGSVRWRG